MKTTYIGFQRRNKKCNRINILYIKTKVRNFGPADMNVCDKKIKIKRGTHVAGGEVDIDCNLRQTAIGQYILNIIKM